MFHCILAQDARGEVEMDPIAGLCVALGGILAVLIYAVAVGRGRPKP